MAQRKLIGSYLGKPVSFTGQLLDHECNYKERRFRNTSGRFSISKQILFRDMDMKHEMRENRAGFPVCRAAYTYIYINCITHPGLSFVINIHNI